MPEYPTEAVREAITNAVCHRDYTIPGTVQVRIYDDRLEVWNPGTLPFGLTIEDLYRRHDSRPRNRLIADAFYRARLIEHWGTGTLRIIEECEAAGLPRPEFTTTAAGSFILSFRKSEAEVVRPELHLNERQRRAIAYVREYGSITRGQHRTLFEVSERQALNDLTSLVEQGVLRREGAGRATRYVLRGSGRVRD